MRRILGALGVMASRLALVPVRLFLLSPPLLTLVWSLRRAYCADRRWKMINLLWNLLREDEGQDIAEYAVMLAVILVIVVGTIRLIGSNANTVFSSAASSIQ